MQSAIRNPQSEIPVDFLSQFRVRTVAEVLDAAFRVYRRNFLTFLLIIFLTLVPIQVISYLIDVFLLGVYNSPELDFTSTNTTSTLAAGNVASQFSTLKTYIEALFEYLAQWALTAALVAFVFGRAVSIRLAYRALGRNLGRAFGLIFLQTLIALAIFSPMICAVLLLFVGSGDLTAIIFPLACLSPFVSIVYLIIDVRLKLALPAAVVERLTPREAIKRSFELTRNYWWRTFALTIVLGILSAIIAAGPAYLITALLGLGINDLLTTVAVTRLVSILTEAIFAPIEMGSYAFYYFDQRVRKEGFDLDTAIYERYEADYDREDYAPTLATAGAYSAYSSYDSYGLPNQYAPAQPVLGGTEPLPSPSDTPQPTIPMSGLQPPAYNGLEVPAPSDEDDTQAETVAGARRAFTPDRPADAGGEE